MAELDLVAGVDTAHRRPIEVIVFQILATKTTAHMLQYYLLVGPNRVVIVVGRV